MPPKIRIRKEEIVSAAVELVRRDGAAALNVRAVAARLGCSTQPIFSNFASVEALRAAVLAAADALYHEYLQRETESGEFPPYKASGMAYIRFATEEKELFKLLFMRDRSAEPDKEDFSEIDRLCIPLRQALGLSPEQARQFHLEMWAFVHGIAVMAATDYLLLDRPSVSRMLTDCYQGLAHRYKEG